MRFRADCWVSTLGDSPNMETLRTYLCSVVHLDMDTDHYTPEDSDIVGAVEINWDTLRPGLTDRERRLLDYALCHLAANIDENTMEELAEGEATEEGLCNEILSLAKEVQTLQ